MAKTYSQYHFRFAPFVITKRQYRKIKALRRVYISNGILYSKLAFAIYFPQYIYRYSTKSVF